MDLADLAADDPLQLTDLETIALAEYRRVKLELESLRLYCDELETENRRLRKEAMRHV